MPLRIGIVGMGNIGNIHAECYEKDELSEIAAVCDIIGEKADKAAEKYSARAFHSVDAMLASGVQLDACSMCTAGKENGGDHHEPSMQLLEAGIPTLGEKPISNEIEKAREMAALAKSKNIPYAINLNHRFTPAAIRAKEWLDSGRLGTPHLLNMRMWIDNPNESSEYFHIRALHPHSFDVMRYFAGDVKSVQANLSKGEGRTIWSNAMINVVFKNGVLGHLTGSYDAGAGYGLEQCDLTGSEGRFVIDEACEVLAFYPRKSQEREVYHHLGGMGGFSDTFGSRLHRWLEQLTDGVPPEEVDGSGQDGLAAQEIIEAAIRSFQTGTVVEL